MKQTVKEAAREHQSKFEVCNDAVLSVSGAYDNGVHDQSYDSFIAGAAWRINSVWHRADERPEDNRAVLAIGEDDYPVIAGPNNEEWEGSAEHFGFTAWAYMDDLLPDTFDRILEANKDVLERIKEKGD